MYVYFAMLYARAQRKVIMHKSCSEIIEYVFAAYLRFIVKFPRKIFHLHFQQLPAQNQPKSQFLFHKNCSLRHFAFNSGLN